VSFWFLWEGSFLLCSLSSCQGRGVGSLVVWWGWCNAMICSCDWCLLGLWAGDQPTCTLSCAVGWEQVLSRQFAVLDKQPLLHVRLFVPKVKSTQAVWLSNSSVDILMGSNNTFLFVTGMQGALDQSLLVSTSQSVEPGILVVYFWAQNAVSFVYNKEAIQYFWAQYSFLYVCAVPPAYYAHLAAFRARFYMEPEASDSGSLTSGPVPAAGRSTGTSMSTRTNRVAVSGSVRPLPPLKENVKKVMFYCWGLLGKTWCNWHHLCEGKKHSGVQ